MPDQHRRPRPEGAPSGVPIFGHPVTFAGRSDECQQAGGAEDLVSHWRRFGPLPHLDPDELIEVLSLVGLTGRGGGHFPVASKWRAVDAQAGSTIVVANGAEGEPLSRKDAALLQLRPHLVLDGLAAAARTARATSTVIWLHDGACRTRDAVERAIVERHAAGLADPRIQIRTGPARYLSGESSAVVRALSGGPALPTLLRVPTATRGIGGRPTLIHNVETLARVALAARFGADTPTGYLLTIAGENALTVIDAPAGMTLASALDSIGWRDDNSAVLVGGYGGTWYSWDECRSMTIGAVEAGPIGFDIGAGVVAPLAPGKCGLAESAAIATYLADSGARQCGPCMFGLPALAQLLTQVTDGDARRRHHSRLDLHLSEVAGRGACHHPDGAARMIASALKTFADDIAWHRKHGRCLTALSAL